MAMRFLLATVAMIALCHGGRAIAQGPARPEERGKIVFPPLTDEQAAEKKQVLAGVRKTAPAERRAPNVVLLLADDLGYGDIGCYGSKEIPTPHIDALARQGMRFTDAYVSAASCSPSRAGILMGRYQERFGFEFNTGPERITERQGRGLDPTAITIADVLRNAGYATGMVGKWHQGTRVQFHPQQRGFDEFFGFLGGAHTYLNPESLSNAQRAVQGERGSSAEILRGEQPVEEPEYLTDAFAREAVSYIDRHKDEPFFLYVPFNTVHTPLQATENYQERFASVKDRKRRTYYAMTSALDDAVGRIQAALEKNGLVDDTLVIFFNDNGGPTYTGVQSNGPLRLGKLFLFEGGIRVPLIVRWPGVVAPGSVQREVTSALDLFPTICAAAGAALPDNFALDGIDLSGTLKGQTSGRLHDALFWRNGPNKAVRKDKWKLVQAGDHVWLFDLATDIGETKNVVKSHPEVVRELQGALSEWESELPKPAWPPRPDSQQVEVDGVPYQLAI